jgi:hypothetical protein
MRTRKQLNKEYEKLQNKIDNSTVGYWAIGSMFLVFVGVCVSCGFPQSVIGSYLFWGGFIGMFIFGGQAAYISEQMKDLKSEWQSNGYGLKKYPTVR